MLPELQVLAYETAVRALDQQERLLDELRARAGIILAASSVVRTFLAPTETAGSGFVEAGLLATFLTSACASVYVLLPRREITLSPSAVSLYSRLSRTDNTADAYRSLVDELHGYRHRNDKTTKKLIEACRVAATALAAQVLLLAAGYGDNII